jgi:3-oxoacyl-[acyl-carrier-protein] synthase II
MRQSLSTNRTRRRVVVTGMGAVTPLGLTVEELWQGLICGRSGIRAVTCCDPSDLSCKVAGEVRGFEPQDFMSPKQVRHMARFSQLAVAATRMAIEDSRLDLPREDAEQLGVLLGNGFGGLPETEEGCWVLFNKGGMKLNPFFMPKVLPNMAAQGI